MAVLDPLNGKITTLDVGSDITLGPDSELGDIATCLGYYTDNTAAHLKIYGFSIETEGTDTNIDINLNTKGIGKVYLNYLTPNSVLYSDSSGYISTGASMLDGEILIGSTGNSPVLSTITSGNNILVTNSSGNIEIGVNGTGHHSVQVGDMAGGLDSLAVGTDGQVLVAATAANPAFATLTSAGGTVVFTPGANTLNLETGGALATSYLTDDANSAIPAAGVLTVAGGTNIGTTSAGSTVTVNLDDTITLTQVNATTFDTNNAASGCILTGTTIEATGTNANIDLNLTPKGTGKVLFGYATNEAIPVFGAGGALEEVGPLTNGQLLIGDTGNTVATSTLTAGTGVSIVNAAGSITINSTGGGVAWSTVAVDTDMDINNGYFVNSAGNIDMTLPTACAVGSIFRVVLVNTGTWTIAQNAGQTIHYGDQDTTTGVAGSIVSDDDYCVIDLVCMTTDTDFVVLNAVGNVLIA